MIITFLFTIIIWLLKLFNTVIPNWNLPSEMYTQTQSVLTTFYQLNFLIPVDILLQMFILVIVFEMVILIIRMSSGLISLIRGGGTLDI